MTHKDISQEELDAARKSDDRPVWKTPVMRRIEDPSPELKQRFQTQGER